MDGTLVETEGESASRPPTSGTHEAKSLEASNKIVAGESPSISSGSYRTTYLIQQDGCHADQASENDKKEWNAKPTRNFRTSSLWRRAEVNPLNGKSFTFPLFRIWDDLYSIAFWLATLGFFVAFFSWFAFSPLVPEAVKADLNLTQDQVTNSNLASLGGTAIVRLIAGPACDKFGPRKVLVALLILGAIPSGLAALVTDIQGLEAVRFFISILGGTFVPTQAYTTTFFDKSIIGTANAFSGGWGNLGGGVTVAVMISLYQRYIKAGYSPHLAWRLCFVTVPVPCLLLVAVIILVFGRDHPGGKWSQRHQVGGLTMEKGHVVGQGGRHQPHRMLVDPEHVPAQHPADFMTSDTEPGKEKPPSPVVEVDTAQSEPLTLAALFQILADLRVWSCALCYFLTFGLETAMDAALPGLINTLFASETFTITEAAYAASTYGLMNLFARPLGGIVSDVLYARFGLRAKLYWLLATALSQGIVIIGLEKEARQDIIIYKEQK